MLFKIFLFLLLLFIIIRFALRFILPVLKLTRITHQKMNEMKSKMENAETQNQRVRPRKIEGDYIDYEEVK